MYIVHGSLEYNVVEASRFNEMSKALVRSEQNVLHLDSLHLKIFDKPPKSDVKTCIAVYCD